MLAEAEARNFQSLNLRKPRFEKNWVRELFYQNLLLAFLVLLADSPNQPVTNFSTSFRFAYRTPSVK